ncbi:MAG TPA: hypothetical protein VGC07_02880 [Granulicella sp.]
MTQPESPASPAAVATPKTILGGYLFGVPVGDLGLFATILVSLSAGFASFFATTFLSIVALLLANSLGHAAIDYSISYKRVGLPVGVLMLVVASTYLGSLWVRRKLRGA